MDENMTVTVEVWPVAADEASIWLLSGADGAYWFGPVKAASDVHYEVEMLLFDHGIDPDSALFVEIPGMHPADVIHSTSWRPHGPTIVLTWMAVVRVPGFVLDSWPGAVPIGLPLLAEVGPAKAHGPAEVPVPQLVHVPFHGLRHLRFLADEEGDAETAAALDANWRRHLAPLRPALARMFQERLAG